VLAVAFLLLVAAAFGVYSLLPTKGFAVNYVDRKSYQQRSLSLAKFSGRKYLLHVWTRMACNLSGSAHSHWKQHAGRHARRHALQRPHLFSRWQYIYFVRRDDSEQSIASLYEPPCWAELLVFSSKTWTAHRLFARRPAFCLLHQHGFRRYRPQDRRVRLTRTRSLPSQDPSHRQPDAFLVPMARPL